MRTDDLHIEYHAGKYQVVRTSNGIDGRVNVGPRHAMPKDAAAYIASLAGIPTTSPIRDAVQGPALAPSEADTGSDLDTAAVPDTASPLSLWDGG